MSQPAPKPVATATPTVTGRRPKRGAGGISVAARAAAGILGGYTLAAFFTTTVALLVRAPREEAAAAGALPSYLVFAGAVIWAFTARTAVRAWLGIATPALLLAAATWWLTRTLTA